MSPPFSEEEICDRVGFADQPQNNSMYPIHATNRFLACTKHVSTMSQ